MKLKAVEYLSTLPPPRDLFHDDFMKSLISSRFKIVPAVSQVGLPRPPSPEEIVQRALGLDRSLNRENLKPHPRKPIDVFHTEIPDLLVDSESEIQELHTIVRKRRLTPDRPEELARIRDNHKNNLARVSRFTFPLR